LIGAREWKSNQLFSSQHINQVARSIAWLCGQCSAIGAGGPQRQEESVLRSLVNSFKTTFLQSKECNRNNNFHFWKTNLKLLAGSMMIFKLVIILNDLILSIVLQNKRRC
jgi:hypothetical protein